MKQFLLSAFLLFACVASAQETYFECDFDDGIPSEFALFDVDGNTPSQSAKELGFEVGKPWIITCVMADQTDLGIVSTSSYSPAGTANDWIITPAIEIKSEYAYFTWSAANVGSSALMDGYKILVSTKGQTVEDFDGADVLYSTTRGESQYGYLYGHMASLKEYAGQTIYIAAVNNSTNKSFLYLDDFWVGEMYAELLMTNTTSNIVTDATAQPTISCTLTNASYIDLTQSATKVTLEVGGETYTKDFGNLSLASGKSTNVSFPDAVVPVPEDGESVNYTLTLTYTAEPVGEQTQTIESALHKPASTFARRVVVEEATGAWCGWCPRGAVGMAAMREKYPDDFIGIAVHCVDIMQVDEYYIGIASYINGYPSAVVNRKTVIDPSESRLESAYKSVAKTTSIASLDITSATFSADGTAVDLEFTSAFGFNSDRTDSNFRYVFVVTENDVQGDTDDYEQTNYYSGGSSGKMGGYESKSNPVPASEMVYQEVARGIDSFTGVEGSVPATVVKDAENLCKYTVELPDNIMDKENIEVVVMLLDVASGEILNADRKKVSSGSGIEEVAEGSAELYAWGGQLFVSLESAGAGPVRVEVYSLDGKKVKEVRSEDAVGTLSVPASDLKGVYVVKVHNGKDVTVGKVIL